MRENTDQNNSEYGDFLRSDYCVEELWRILNVYDFFRWKTV